MTARGTFEVKLTDAPAETTGFSRLFLDKRFAGDLDATSTGQMLGAMTATEGSGGYVAMEVVTGTLHGKRGSFILQHRGTMKGGGYSMDVSVVPDSGTEELAGLSGAMKIIIEGERHSYEFAYALS